MDTGVPGKWLEFGWGGSKIQRLKFDSIYLTDESLIRKKYNLRMKCPKSDVFGLD
jgi:hypothetical protein